MYECVYACVCAYVRVHVCVHAYVFMYAYAFLGLSHSTGSPLPAAVDSSGSVSGRHQEAQCLAPGTESLSGSVTAQPTSAALRRRPSPPAAQGSFQGGRSLFSRQSRGCL